MSSPETLSQLGQRRTEKLAGRHESFLQGLNERSSASVEEIETRLRILERDLKHPDRLVSFYTNPKLKLAVCTQIPAKVIDSRGQIIDDPNHKQYLIGLPYLEISRQAPDAVLRGYAHHEIGHGLYTDFGMWRRCREFAENQGYDPTEIQNLLNCVEDPRMERLIGGPMHPGVHSDLLAKNIAQVIPAVAASLSRATPTEQFMLLAKLEGLWNINAELKRYEKPWDLEQIHPAVKEAYEKAAPILARIIGDSEHPPLKVGYEYERLMRDEIWSTYRGLIDQFPATDEEDAGDSNKDGESVQSKSNEEDFAPGPQKGRGKLKEPKEQQENGKLDSGKTDTPEEPGEGKNLRQGARSPEGENVPEHDAFDPSDPSELSPELEKLVEQMTQEHEDRLEQLANEIRAENERKKQEIATSTQIGRDLLQHREGFQDPVARERYRALSSEVRPVRQRIERLFKRFFPKQDELSIEWKRSGGRFDVKRLVRNYGTGSERPLGKREQPEKRSFLLQLIVDVSSSTHKNERLLNEIKTCVALAEAAEGTDVSVEILASDNGNVETNPSEYLIKAFGDSFNEKTKTKIVGMLQGFGGGNGDYGDANSINAAVRRLKKRLSQVRPQSDRVGTLTVFLTDSTTQSTATGVAVRDARAEGLPLEGLAITNEADVAQAVRNHFGRDSVIPKTVEELPDAMQTILIRHVTRFAR